MSAPRVLFAVAELFPLIKTGGLADVAAALPAALAELGIDVRIALPAYPGLREQLRDLHAAGSLALERTSFALWQGRHPHSGVAVLLFDAPVLFDRPGNPYLDPAGRDQPDNALRFAAFCQAVAAVARGYAGSALAADLVHLNDWHTGLVPLYLGEPIQRPRSLFTIHNLAYQGLFERADFDALGLPAALWRPQGIEFWGRFSFLKAGLHFADALTTVSPRYAEEIRTPAFGEGLDGILRDRADVLHGILNGIDVVLWNPRTDAALPRRYGEEDVAAGKAENKRALQQALGLEEDPAALLLVFIGRLVEQKGADALLAARSVFEQRPVQLALLGSGDPALQRAFGEWAQQRPQQIAVQIGYDEALAHRLTAAADAQIMPSRYEPCGMNQMYAQRYGAVPLVRRVGGLADSVAGLDAAQPSGIQFEHSDAGGVRYALDTALELFHRPQRWRQLQHNGMGRDFSWQGSARRYVELYAEILGAAPHAGRGDAASGV